MDKQFNKKNDVEDLIYQPVFSEREVEEIVALYKYNYVNNFYDYSAHSNLKEDADYYLQKI